MTAETPKVRRFLCSWCKRGVVESLPATCPNPECRAELSEQVSPPMTVEQTQRVVDRQARSADA